MDVIRQANGGTIDDGVKNIESIALALLEQLRNDAQTASSKISQEPNTGMLTSDPAVPDGSEVPDLNKTVTIEGMLHDDKTSSTGKQIHLCSDTTDNS